MLTARLKKASLLQANHKETAVQVELGTAGSGGGRTSGPFGFRVLRQNVGIYGCTLSELSPREVGSRTSQAGSKWRLRISCQDLKCFPGYCLSSTLLFKRSGPTLDASWGLFLTWDSRGCRNPTLASSILSSWSDSGLQFKLLVSKRWARNFWLSKYFI